MKESLGIDIYTKAILTVIAVSLSVIAFKDISLIPEAVASGDDIQKVEIIRVSPSVYPLGVTFEGKAVDVKIVNKPLDVILNNPFYDKKKN